jgi:hypothetical protein
MRRQEPPNHAIQVRLVDPLFRALEDWRRRQPQIPYRSRAIRELLSRALEAERRRQPSTPSHVTTNSIQKFEKVRPTSPP